MAGYVGSIEGITPSTLADLWTLDAAAGKSGKVSEIMLGGEASTSTVMRTRVARSSGGVTPTAGNVQKKHPNSPANGITFAVGWTTQPTLAGGNLVAVAWNAFGGLWRWVANPGEELFIIGPAEISCRQAAGAGVVTGHVAWIED